MYKIKIRIGDHYYHEHTVNVSFKDIYKGATSMAKWCYNGRTRFALTVESQSGETLLRVFTFHSKIRDTWVARVASNESGTYNKCGLTLRRSNG